MTNVVPLPTAAPKKVRQCPSRTRAADRKALLPFPDRYKTPAEWRAEKSAAIIAQIEMTPAMAMAVAMFQTLETVDQWKAQAFLARLVDCRSREAVVQALEYALFVTAPFHSRRAVNQALQALQAREG